MDGAEVLRIWKRGDARRARMASIRAYYDGKQIVEELKKKRIDGREKSKANTNWTRYAASLHTGFLTSIPVGYALREASTDGKTPEVISDWTDTYQANGLAAADSEHFRTAFLYGHSVEAHSFDGEQVNVRTSWPWEWELVYDRSERLVLAIRKETLPANTMVEGRILEKEATFFRVYDSSGIELFRVDGEGDDAKLVFEERVAHEYGRPPVVVFRITEDGCPFLTPAFFVQCDAYDIARSSFDDDIKHNVDSLLLLKGVDFNGLLQKDEKGRLVIEKLKEMGVFPVEKEASAEYLVRTVDVEKFRFNLKVARASIHLMACVPDLDETIGGNEGTITNISGVALKLMFYSMNQASGEFEKHFVTGLADRVGLWNRVREVLRRPALEAYEAKMRRNLPFNETELLQYLPNLGGVMSTADKLKVLPFVDNPGQAYANLLAEKKSAADQQIPKPGDV